MNDSRMDAVRFAFGVACAVLLISLIVAVNLL